MNLAAGLCLFLSASLVCPQAAFSAPLEPVPGTDFQLPKTPTAPPMLTVRKATDPFVCKRAFTHRGKIYSCDSYLSWDGENLRPILAEIPAAVKELDDYQATRNRVNNLAYVGAVGFTLLVVGILGSRAFDGGTRNAVRNAGVLSGLGLMGGTFVYGITVLRSNETRLGNAVQIYNQARPSDPIELQFSTGVSF